MASRKRSRDGQPSSMPSDTHESTTITALHDKASTTPSARSVATEQLDSDDDDISKRASLHNTNNHSQSSILRQERKQLYQLQEQKRRRREDTTCAQKRRSKELKDGKTPRRQKVERLRNERLVLEKEYEGASLKKKKRQKRRKHNIPLPGRK